jgi:hypothetical protein
MVNWNKWGKKQSWSTSQHLPRWTEGNEVKLRENEQKINARASQMQRSTNNSTVTFGEMLIVVL